MRRKNQVSYDFYHLVPKDRMGNLKYRQEIYTKCAKDPVFRKNIWIACKRDTLYFFNTFLWVYEPRAGQDSGQGKLPFITWPNQDEAIQIMDLYWGLEDIRFWKTRGEGATWMASMRQLKDWLFEPSYNPAAFGIVTRNEETVDSPDDPDSIFWKFDWQIKQLPTWMIPKYVRKVSEHTLKNIDTESTIVGYSASEDVGSGGRKRVFMMDELAKFGAFRTGADAAAMASTMPVTECRLVISTPKGTANAYFDSIAEVIEIDKYQVTKRLFTEEDHALFRELGLVVLHWSENPTRNRGLYRVEPDGIVALDETKYGPIPDEYRARWPEIRLELEKRGYQVMGTIRSEWYDRQCLRSNATPQSVAQEYDLDFGGSGYTLFDANTVEIALQSCRAPVGVGEMYFDDKLMAPEWVQHGNGRMRLWYHLMPDTRRPNPADRFVVGADIASGLGGSSHSNSVACVLNLDTGEQVAEWVSNSTPPIEFCDQCIAIAKFFNNAKVIHEANGPFGKAFTGRLLFREYGNVFRNRSRYSIKHKRSDNIGWGSQQESKADMLANLGYKIRRGTLKIRSRDCVGELKSWVMKAGKIQHSKAANTEDESSKNEAHGDRAIALGVAAIEYDPDQTKESMRDSEPVIFKLNAPPNSMAWRLEKWDREHQSPSSDW